MDTDGNTLTYGKRTSEIEDIILSHDRYGKEGI